MDGDPGDICGSDLDFAGVQSGPQGHALCGRRVEQLDGALHGPGGAVERREDPVTGLFDDPSAVGVDEALRTTDATSLQGDGA